MRIIVSMMTVGLLLSSPLQAKQTSKTYANYKVPSITEYSFNDSEYVKVKKEWSKQNRKVASSMSFNGGDLSPDFKKLRDEWLKVKNGNEMEALLKKSHANYGSFSSDTQYFLSQMHLAIPLRGIVWKLRPLFEKNKGFLGNSSTHVTAIQAVRNAVTGLSMFLPTEQTDAGIEYFTEPSVSMSKADQFKSMTEFQQFVTETMIPAINEATQKLVYLAKESQAKPFVWDNKIAFGRATFEDEVNRFVGNGPAEVNFAIASLYRAQHDLLVYCAFNQDHAIKVAGEIGTHFGVDSSMFAKKKDLGITDQERVSILKSATNKHHFLELRNYEGTQYGSKLMKQAYVALKNSVVFFERSYDYLQGRDSTNSFAFNPVLFQPENAKNLDKGIKNMKALVQGPTEVRDPVTGQTVVINLPGFYQEPPQSLKALMATGFDDSAPNKTIVNKKGEKLQVRNYLRGRSIAWDNNAWKKYVPSAEGQKADYMYEANRVIRYSFGTNAVFGLTEVFVH